MSHDFQAVRLRSSSTLLRAQSLSPLEHIRSEQPNIESPSNLHEISEQIQDKLNIGFKLAVRSAAIDPATC
jgi:hypothetical protein